MIEIKIVIDGSNYPDLLLGLSSEEKNPDKLEKKIYNLYADGIRQITKQLNDQLGSIMKRIDPDNN